MDYPPNTGLPDLRSLPPTLTQEQLHRLDVVTREALDERIRILENLQGVMWRCAEELIRMRSVLPPPPPPPLRQGVPTPFPQSRPPTTAPPTAARTPSEPYVVSTDTSGGSEGIIGNSTGVAALQEESTGSAPSASTSQSIVPAAVSAEVTESDASPSVVAETVIEPTE